MIDTGVKADVIIIYIKINPAIPEFFDKVTGTSIYSPAFVSIFGILTAIPSADADISEERVTLSHLARTCDSLTPSFVFTTPSS